MRSRNICAKTGPSVGAAVPRWTVVIPTWNGRDLVAEALEGLAAQTLKEHSVVVVDDASTDGTVRWLVMAHPTVRVVPLEVRGGLARAVNRGIAVASTPYIALLNNDAVPDPGWLGALDSAFANHPEASLLASRIRLYDRPSVLHAVGDTYGRNGVPGNRGVWMTDAKPFDEPCEVFGACGAASAYRRTLFDDIGVFDEDLGMYCEDVDLSWRALLAGHRCRYVPGATVRHRLSATGGGPFASYLVARNQILVAAMNIPGSIWGRMWWRFLVAQLRLSVEAVQNVRGSAARATLRGQAASLRKLRQALRKRRGRQGSRRVADAWTWSRMAAT